MNQSNPERPVVTVHFPFVVEPARFVARPNRFLVLAARMGTEQESREEIVRVHCADPGRLRELLVPDARLYISPCAPEHRATRRTQYDLRFVNHRPESIGNDTSNATHGDKSEQGVLVSLDTRIPNRVVEAALRAGALPQFSALQKVTAEAAGPAHFEGGIRSRFDFHVVADDGQPWWIEVKSATLVENGHARFPDAPTTRGRRHLLELAEIVRGGHGCAAVIFVVQRRDAVALSAHRQRDPAFADALIAAHQAGVEIMAFGCALTTTSITLEEQIPVLLV